MPMKDREPIATPRPAVNCHVPMGIEMVPIFPHHRLIPTHNEQNFNALTLHINQSIILGMGSGNERRRYFVTTSFIGWAYTQSNPCRYVFPSCLSLSLGISHIVMSQLSSCRASWHHTQNLPTQIVHAFLLRLYPYSISRPTSVKWELVCHKHVLRAGTSNYIPWILWDVISCPCPWYLPNNVFQESVIKVLTPHSICGM